MTPPDVPMKTRLQDAVWIGGVIIGVLGAVWGAAVAFAGMQTDDEAKESLAPVVAKVEAQEAEFQGFKVRVSTDIAQLQTKTDGIDEKIGYLIGQAHRSHKLQEAQVAPVVRQRAKRAASAARKTLAEAPEDDPLAGLEDL